MWLTNSTFSIKVFDWIEPINTIIFKMRFVLKYIKKIIFNIVY